MALPASDNFNRTNESPLAGNWTAPDGVADSKFVLTSNHLEGQGASTLQWMYWNADSFNGNHKSQVTLSGGTQPTGAGTYAGVAVRVQASGQSGYYFGVVAGAYKLKRLDSGTEVLLVGVSDTPTLGDVLRLEINGTGLTAYINGVSKATATDTTYSGGAAGLFGYGGVDKFEMDDWSGDNLAAATVVDWLPTLDNPGIGRKLSVVTYGNHPGRN